MDLEDAVTKLADKHLSDSNDWYRWKKINTARLPPGIDLPSGNEYQQNIVLKEQLHQRWQTSPNQAERDLIIHYYIAVWGGIGGNTEAKLKLYSRSSPDELIARGDEGVASWSKALCVIDPEKYAIFDARVSMSLNLLQILDNVVEKSLLPVLPSQNGLIGKANKALKIIAKEQAWLRVPSTEFYDAYLNLLRKAARKTNSSIATIEMLLFAKAEELIHAAIGDNVMRVCPMETRAANGPPATREGKTAAKKCSSF